MQPLLRIARVLTALLAVGGLGFGAYVLVNGVLGFRETQKARDGGQFILMDLSGIILILGGVVFALGLVYGIAALRFPKRPWGSSLAAALASACVLAYFAVLLGDGGKRATDSFLLTGSGVSLAVTVFFGIAVRAAARQAAAALVGRGPFPRGPRAGA